MTRIFGAALAAAFLPASVAADISIDDAYARASGPAAKAGAAFMVIENTGETDDRLIAATSPASARVELHTHIDDGGVMRMVEVEDGIAIPAGGTAMLIRGGDHVMFMGLAASWSQGDMIPVTLTFEKAGEMTMEIPVDLERKPDHGGMSTGHDGHTHSDHGS